MAAPVDNVDRPISDRLSWDKVPDRLVRELVHDQYRLAIHQQDQGWIREARYFAALTHATYWIDDVLPSRETSVRGRSRSPLNRSQGPRNVDQRMKGSRQKGRGQSDIGPRGKSAHLKGNAQRDRGNRPREIHRNCGREEVPVGPKCGVQAGSKKRHTVRSGRGRHYGCEPAPSAATGRPSTCGSPKSRSKGIETERKPQGKPRPKSKCPAAGCGARSSHLKKHVELHHIPRLFWESASGDRVPERRAQALKVLALLLTGRPDSVLLVNWIDRNLVGSTNLVSTNPALETAMRAVCKAARWEIPEEFSFVRVTSPVVLVHWRVMCLALNHLPGVQRQAYIRDPLDGKVCQPEVTETSVSMEVTPSDVEGSNDDPEVMEVPDIEIGLECNDEAKVIVVPVDETPVSGDGAGAIEVPVMAEGNTKEDEEVPVEEVIRSIDSVLAESNADERDQVPEASVEESEQTAKPKLSYSGAVRKPKPPTKVLEVVVEQKSAGCPVGFDSHFHLDRTAQMLFKEDWTKIERVLEFKQAPGPKNPVRITGGIVVCCDPERYEAIQSLKSPGYKLAVGVHPKKAGSFGDPEDEKLQVLLTAADVVALGEIGLDWSVPSQQWAEQEEVLEKLLQRHVSLRQVLVLHVRGPHNDPSSPDVYDRCLQIVSKYCKRLQPMHLHCFVGTLPSLEQWMKRFPNCYFGFTGKVRNFGYLQRQALMQVPRNRLLLETDSPHLALTSKTVNTPAYLGDVAKVVAQSRMVLWENLLMEANMNAKRLYSLN